MIDTFTLEKVNKAGAVFDYKKLEWMQSEYMKKSAPQNFVSVVKQELENKGINGIDDDYVVRVITLLRERVQFPHQIADFGNYMFEIPKSYDDEFRAKVWTEKAQQALPEVIALLRSAEDFNHTALHQTVQAYLAEKKMGFKDVMNPLRLLVTGKSVGAGMFETMEVLGKQATLERIDAILGLLTH
jgi:glutamyl-tRNA synthetase